MAESVSWSLRHRDKNTTYKARMPYATTCSRTCLVNAFLTDCFGFSEVTSSFRSSDATNEQRRDGPRRGVVSTDENVGGSTEGIKDSASSKSALLDLL